MAVRSWLQSVTEETDENTVIVILENKSDLLEENDSKRCVPKATIDKIVRASTPIPSQSFFSKQRLRENQIHRKLHF
ncbi:unnamed protein product [Trichobilharzia regenti]|nr:unnamed protein product [Trichobilharzia regenti]